MPHIRAQLGWASVFLAVMIFALLPSMAHADSSQVPKSPLKQTIRAGEWTFELHGPERPSLQVAGYPTEIVVRHREAGIITLLQPTRFLPCAAGGPKGCVPIDLMGRTSVAVKRTKMVVSDHDGFVPPEVTTTFYTGGTRCCYVSVGFWQPQDGPWQASRLSSGNTEPISDRRGRLRIGDPRWETLDWPAVAARPFYTWHKLMNGEGWRHASTRADVRTELKRTKAALRQLTTKRGSQSRAAIRSTRGVLIGYQKALGQAGAVAAGRRAYRMAYGLAALRRLDKGLNQVRQAQRTASSSGAKPSAVNIDPTAQTPQELMDDLARDLSTVKSFRYLGTVTDPGGRTRLNGVSTSQGRSRMTLTVGRQVSRMILLPSRVYWNFNRAFVLANFDRTRSNLRNAGRWLATSKRNAGELGTGIAESEPKRLARCLTQATGTLRHDGSAVVAGKPAIVIVDQGDRPGTTPRKLFLSASGPRLPLRVVQTGKRKAGGSPDLRCRGEGDDTLRSDLRFSGFNARVKIAAPKRTLRL